MSRPMRKSLYVQSHNDFILSNYLLIDVRFQLGIH